MQDLYSYGKERAKGVAVNNVLTVLMVVENLDLQAASDYVGKSYAELMKEYLTAKAELRLKSFGSKDLDADIRKYVDAMQDWPIGNLEWSFKSNRWADRLFPCL